MKKLYLLFLFSFLLFEANAQVEFGLKAGPMLSRTYVSSGDSIAEFSDAKISFLAGGFMRLPLASELDLQAELLFSSKGNKFVDLNYVSIPLMLQYEFFPNLRAEAGVDVGYLIGTNNSFSVGLFEKHPFYKRLDAGLNAGLNYDFLNRLNVGLRYNLGILDVQEYDTRFSFGTPPTDFNVKNHTLQLSLGYWFR